MKEETADWTFGDGAFVKIYGDRLAQSSLMDTAVATRWVFVFMLSQADADGRYRCATVPALARAANVSLEEAQTAVRELEAPDPASTTKDQDGRRIVAIPGGWRIVNKVAYREFRTKEQVAAAERKRRQREAEKAGERDMSRDVTGGHSDGRADVRGQIPEAAVVVDPLPSEGKSSNEQRARAREAPPRVPRCTQALTRGTCGHELVRERGLYPSPATGGRGWLCNARAGGCGFAYPRDAPEVLRQLTPGARAALDREIAAETAGRSEQAAEASAGSAKAREVARLAEEFLGDAKGARAAVEGATDAFGLWGEISAHVAKAVPPHLHSTWFRPAAGVRLDGSRLVVAVPNPDFARWLSGNYRTVIASAVEALRRDGIEVAFVTEGALLLERFNAWADGRGLKGERRREILQAVRRQLGEPAT